MATLSGNKIKDTYTSLLKLDSNGATTTIKAVEDGAGTDTALSLSTDTVQVDKLKFTSAPNTDNAELTALLVDGSNNVVKRELNAIAFTGSATQVFANPMWVLRPNAAYTLTSSAATPTQSAVNNSSNTSSHEVNDSSNHFQTSATTTGAVNVQQGGLVKIDVNFMLEVTSENTDIIVDIMEKPSGGSAAIIQSITRSHASAGNTAIGFSLVRSVDDATDLYYTVRNSGGGASLIITSTFILTKLN
jgi:hypothetical protein